MMGVRKQPAAHGGMTHEDSEPDGVAQRAGRVHGITDFWMHPPFILGLTGSRWIRYSQFA